MSVRRLDPVQPEGFAFTPENLAWAHETIAKYPPGKQASAVIPVLWRAQEQNAGWVSRAAMEYVATLLDMAYIRVYEVATFYTMFQLSPVGTKAHVQVCGTTPCMLRGAGDLIEVCRRRIAHEPHGLSADGAFSWEEVECLGACVNAPMVQVWKDTYEDLTPETFGKVLDAFVRGEHPKPGPQNGRRFAAPEGGPTTLIAGPWQAAAKPAVKPAKADAAPQLLKKPRGGTGDDLKLIRGVGPALEKMLNGMGVWHFDQIAAWTATELKWVDDRLEGFKGRVKRDEWVKQAKKLAGGWRPDNSVGEKAK